MLWLWILLGIIVFLAVIIGTVWLFGIASIRVICKEKLNLFATICGIRIPLYSSALDMEHTEPKKELIRCRFPELVLKRELETQKKAYLEAEKKRAQKQERLQKGINKIRSSAEGLSVEETIRLIQLLTVNLYTRLNSEHTEFHVHRFSIRVATEDAAKTAILYGVILQSASYLLQWIEDHIVHMNANPGDMEVVADFDHKKSSIEIDAEYRIPVKRGLRVMLDFIRLFRQEKENAFLRMEQENGDRAAS